MIVKTLITVSSIALLVMMAPSLARSKGILEILRDKGVITEEEYRQAVEEARALGSGSQPQSGTFRQA